MGIYEMRRRMMMSFGRKMKERGRMRTRREMWRAGGGTRETKERPGDGEEY